MFVLKSVEITLFKKMYVLCNLPCSKDLKLLRHVSDSEHILTLFLDGKFHIFTKYAFPSFIHLCVTIPI